MLLHQPFCDRYGAYRALEDACKEGKLRAIGVSNFYPDHFIDIAGNMEIVPAVNQVEMHVFNQQTEPQKIMEEFGTHIMSWGPFAEGRGGLFTNVTLAHIGARHGKSVARAWHRWHSAGSYSAAPSSFLSHHTWSGCSRTSTSSTSS